MILYFIADAQINNIGSGTGPMFLDDVVCTGSELLLAHCSHPGVNLIQSVDCTFEREDVGIICTGLPTFDLSTQIS